MVFAPGRVEDAYDIASGAPLGEGSVGVVRWCVCALKIVLRMHSQRRCRRRAVQRAAPTVPRL